ncbi:MAG: thiolase domain-containing protein [Bacteroidetes bacterium]|nr:thiolase domain-containing protein [Bacteroidota bacterium]MBU1423801.1 thiolase domain-containing protein [Bacteroidota bacterium]MBU2470930.1 thiolase domain-containing protein [Bacteroidota bacterium]MBU2637119.1 thiolase domain-containing protein [Bacteroidota bacterium]
MRDVFVIGAGMTKFGELWEKSIKDIFVEAGLKAIEDAGVGYIDSLYVGAMSSGLFVGQEHLGAVMADYLGVNPVPATRVESACASGGVSFRQAYLEVASGASDIVLAGGVEKMTDGADVTDALATAADQEYEVYHGVTFPGLYAMIAKAHMHQYGTTRQQLAAVAVKNHRNGAKNPNAQFRFEVTLEQVLNSTRVADPLGLLDCSPVSDGGAAVILVSAEVARNLKKPLIRVIASSQASDTIALHSRPSFTTIGSVVKAAEKAYKMAGIKPTDVNLCEVHDCFTIAEIVVSEDLGFFEKGKGGEAVEKGLTALEGGKMPINTSGGLKSKGHPVGATGIAQIIEVYEQLSGKAGARQVKNARIGMAQNMGGSGASCVIHILEVK